jgi:molybdenum cofactor cytidylyltransferase
MGGPEKLLLPVGGVPLVRRSAGTLLAAGLSPVVVVVGAGAGAEAVGRALSGLPVRLVVNPRASEGMGTSLALGVSVLPPGARAVAIALGDMPRVEPGTLRRLLEGHRETGAGIVVPTWRGRRGHPVVFDLRRYREELRALGGDVGARDVLASHPADVLEVDAGDPGVVADVDTPEDYRALEQGSEASCESAGEPSREPAQPGGTGPLVRDEAVIREINQLWAPIYPYMAEHVLAVAALRRGAALDLGPFAGGLAVELLARCEGLRVWLVDEFSGVPRWARGRARGLGVERRLGLACAGLGRLPVRDGAFDLVTVRGAFFFLDSALLREIRRVLRPGGFAWVGGGYGPRTPASAIAPIAEASRRLNAAIGKRRLSARGLGALARAAGLGGEARVVEEGGLWLEVRA